MTTVTASDADLPAQTLTYSISGGADAARFTIDGATGVLRFLAAPNYETPADAGANNVYDVTVQVSDGTLTDSQAIAVTVTAVNDNSPVDHVQRRRSHRGHQRRGEHDGRDDGDRQRCGPAGTDADLLDQRRRGRGPVHDRRVRPACCVSWRRRTTKCPTDAGANNVYDVTVQVSDGTLTDSQAIAVTVTAVNDNSPAITSNGGGATAAISIAENTTAVTTVTASDADLPAQTLIYSISGGADAARFTIDGATGVLSFLAAPDYEAPTDAGANNVYDVTVQVSDGTLTDTQAIAVTVTAVNDNSPVITSNGGGATATISIAENTTAVTTVTATDADLPVQTLTYSISGGADAARFTIDSATGVLSFLAAPDYELPTDAGANNVYDVTVQVSDGALVDVQTIAVTVAAVNDAPVASDDSYTVNGDSTLNVAASAGVLANDSDVEGDTLTALLVHGPAHGNATLNPDGSFTYTPHADFIGTDRVGYRVSDGMLTSDVAVVSVVVNPGLQFIPPAEDNQAKPQRHGEEPAASDQSEAPEAEAATKADNTNGGEAAPPSPGAAPGPHAQAEVTPEAAWGQDPAVHGEDGGEIVSGSSESNVIPRPASDAARAGNLRAIKTITEASSPGDRGTSAGRYRTEVATQQYAHVAGPGQLWRTRRLRKNRGFATAVQRRRRGIGRDDRVRVHRRVRALGAAQRVAPLESAGIPACLDPV